ncbi:MAG: hypothetical protein HZA34_00590 [Candidatus Pacebacteria bacterium]|nr:hypothetical protein [Candidatus Paceibacterota bacterium]
MSDQTDILLSQVMNYGLSSHEGRAYLFLLHKGFSTALRMSRELHMGRTKVYRILDILKKKEFVEFRVDDRGMQFGAVQPTRFQRIIAEKEGELHELKASFPDLLTQLQTLSHQERERSKVLYYEGIEGLKQVSYNITRAKGELRVFEMEHLSDFLPMNFSEHIRNELVEHGIHTKDLTNKTSFPGFTDVKEMIEHYSEYRYIDPKKLKIMFEVLIYNDVYATYTYKNDQIFCVEIYNDQLAAMQKQLFDFIWTQALPMHYTDARGAAVLSFSPQSP